MFDIRDQIEKLNIFKKKEKEIGLQAKLAKIIINFSDPEELKNKIIKAIAITLNASRCFFIEYDLSTNNFKKIINSYNAERTSLSILGNDIEKTIPSFSMKLKYMKSFIINDAKKFIKINKLEGSKEDYYFKNYKIKATLAVRLEFGEIFLGVIVVHYDNRKIFLKYTDLEFLKNAAEYISIALYLSTLYSEEKKEREKERLLRSIISIMSSGYSLNQITQKTFEILARIYDTQSIFINMNIEGFEKVYFYNPSSFEIENQQNKNEFIDYNLYSSPVFDLNKNKLNYIADTHNFIIQNNLKKSNIEKYFKTNNIKSLILLPILYENLSLGVLTIHFDKINQINKNDLDFLATATEQLAISINQARVFKKQKKTVERERLLRDITEKIRSSLDIDETLSFICNEIAKVFKVQRTTVATLTTTENYILSEYKNTPETKGMKQINNIHELADFWRTNILENNGSFSVDNLDKSEIPDHIKNTYISMGVKSIIGIIIKKDEDIWGTLVLSEYNNYRHWNNEEIALLKIISNQIYIAIKQSGLYNKIQKTAENEKVLRKIMLATVSTFDIIEIIKSIVTEVGKLFKADRCYFVENDYETNLKQPQKELTEYLSSDDIQSYTTRLPNDELRKIIIQTLMQKKVMAIDDINNQNFREDTILLLNDLSVKSFLMTPIYYGEILYGGLFLHYVNNSKQFTQDDIDVIQTIANQSAIIIHQAKLYSKIKTNEKYTSSVINNIKDAIITIDNEFIIKSCNPATETIWGYPLNEIIGKPLDLLLQYECHDEKKTTCFSTKEFTGKRQNGEEFPVEIDVSEINFEDKELILLLVRDITERKRIEKMKNEFVSTVSHELRTPLTSIKGSLGLIVSGMFGKLPNKVDELINIANNNCTRLTNLINDILDIEKIKKGEYEFSYEELEINSIIEQSFVLNKPFADQAKIKIKLIKNVEKAFVRADKSRLLQVIANLISNAIKFSNQESEIKIITDLEDNNVKVSFEDKGIGIPENSKHKIFKSFSQVDSSDTRSKGGTGLGLSICKFIIKKMNGEIGFESEEGKGSTFFFTIPKI